MRLVDQQSDVREEKYDGDDGPNVGHDFTRLRVLDEDMILHDTDFELKNQVRVYPEVLFKVVDVHVLSDVEDVGRDEELLPRVEEQSIVDLDFCNLVGALAKVGGLLVEGHEVVILDPF